MRKLPLMILFITCWQIGHCICDEPYSNTTSIPLVDGELWWGGAINDGTKMPFENGYTNDLYGNLQGNQAQPLLISNKGRIIWSETPFKFTVKDKALEFESIDELLVSNTQSNLKGAFQFASSNYFPPDRQLPDLLLFEQPQYNTWIELTYDQNQKDILEYARAIIDNGFPPGVLMIDDNWQRAYGDWRFRPDQFPNPKAMIDELHSMGFKVMLWVCPFVSADTETFRRCARNQLFLKQPTRQSTIGSPSEDFRDVAMIGWWNGHSALLDFSNPDAKKWFTDELKNLVDEFKIDGFKLDAGDAVFYPNTLESYQKQMTPNSHSEMFAEIGLDFPLNEYRATWKMAGKPLVQRLRDKRHSWQDLQTLIPNITTQGLMGYAFTCPDMIGGGEFKSFLNDATIDQELIVRSAQVHALMPMMQFSVAPWRILDEEYLLAVKDAVELRKKFNSRILALAKSAAIDGQPIVRSMEYVFPLSGYEKIKDQFCLGENVLVAPVLKKGKRSRKVELPTGEWTGFDGRIYSGGRSIEIEAGLNTLPYFVRSKK